MNFKDFYKYRLEHKEWMRMNGLNEGAPDKNGEFTAFITLKKYCDVFVDIGANNGIFVDQWNDIGSEVKSLSSYALIFEPNPNLKPTLEKKIVHGRLVQEALSDEVGTATFNIYSVDDTTSSLLDREDMMPHFTDAVTKLEVKINTLDSYISEIQKQSGAGLFIKMDVEGVELPVLKGARELLATTANVFLMFEYSKAWKLGGHSLKDAFHLLDRLGLRLFRVTPLGLEALRFYTPEMDGPDYCNYFAAKGFDLKAILECTPIPSDTHNWNDFYIFP